MNNQLKKVLWTEGQLLTQHHLQQWDQYWQQYCRGVLPKNLYGLRRLVIDDAALLQGEFKILQCEVLFEDGSYVNYQQAEGRELKCRINQPNEQIYLGVLQKNRVESIDQCLGRNDAGWLACKELCDDLYIIGKSRELMFVEDIVEVYVSSEPRQDCISMPIAKYEYLPTGICRHDRFFVPVSVYLSAATSVQDFLKKIISKVASYVNAIKAKGVVCWREGQERRIVLNDLYYDFIKFLLKTRKIMSIKDECALADVYQHLSLFFGYLSFFIKKKYNFEKSYTHFSSGECFKELMFDGLSVLQGVDVKENNRVFLYKEKNYYRFKLSELQEKSFKLVMVVDCQDISLINNVSIGRHIKIARESQMETIISSSLSGFNLVPVLKESHKTMHYREMRFEVLLNDGQSKNSREVGQEFFLIYVSSVVMGIKINLFLEEKQRK